MSEFGARQVAAIARQVADVEDRSSELSFALGATCGDDERYEVRREPKDNSVTVRFAAPDACMSLWLGAECVVGIPVESLSKIISSSVDYVRDLVGGRGDPPPVVHSQIGDWRIEVQA